MSETQRSETQKLIPIDRDQDSGQHVARPVRSGVDPVEALVTVISPASDQPIARPQRGRIDFLSTTAAQGRKGKRSRGRGIRVAGAGRSPGDRSA